MNTLDFGVQEPYKSYILSGEKTIEGRLNKGKFKAINIGDILEFDTGEKFELINKYLYPTFEEMLAREGLKHVLPDKKTIKD
ncbi:MAG: isomerase [Patescibacteria group bacterium]|nr:isomerase [Patescibacteria group bacterium]